MLLAGLAMIVLPGPGIVVIIAGLAILASEFSWAERLLDAAKVKLHEARTRVGRSRRRRR